MVRINFTQCDTTVSECGYSRHAMRLPVIPRCDFYIHVLTELTKTEEYTTTDENFLLIAQWMKRTGRLKELTFVSICGCGGDQKRLEIATDDDGDMLDDPHHGFFRQRLRFLR